MPEQTQIVNEIQQPISNENAIEFSEVSDFIINEEFVNRTNKRGLKDGIWKSFYKNGKVQLEGRYINNKRDGFFREYSESGKLLNTYKYKDGELIEDVEEFKDIKVKKTEWYAPGLGLVKLIREEISDSETMGNVYYEKVINFN